MAQVHKAKEIAQAKQDVVKKLVELIKKYPIIGSIDMENLPAAQLQNMKQQLRGKVEMFMTKRRLMKIAIEKAKADKQGIEKIEEHLKGMPALLFTNENPFSLFRTVKKNKSKAPAKAGQTAPSDIIVKAGPTSFAPGPVISELGGLGIKSKVEDGKIAIVEDAVVCKEGEEISAPLAGMLTRLGIKPMEIGLNIVAVYEKGDIFTKDILDIDDDKFMADLTQAGQWAFNLACETAFLTDLNKEILIQKAFRDSKALALEANILADAVVEELLAKAESEMKSLKSQLPEAPAPKEEPKPEEKKEEAPKEAAKPEVKKEEVKEEAKEEKAEAPKVEEKAPEPVKEEPKVEEKPAEPAPKPEEKAPEPEAKPETPKSEEKPAEEAPKEEPKAEPTTEEKVDNMVEKAKAQAEGKLSAESLLEDAEKEVKEEKKEVADPKEVEQLAERLVKKGTLQDVEVEKPKAEKKEEKKEGDKSEEEKVEDLTAELLKKGTLRK